MDITQLEKLNREFGIRNHLTFNIGPGGFVIAKMQNPLGEATVALHGGHVLSFRPRGHAPVLWLSRHSHFQPGKAVRGGIPVCWPWFADHPSDTAKPAHGFVRTAGWSVSASETLADESTRLKLSLADNAETLKLWPHRFRLVIDITVSDVLGVKLIATNTDSEPFICGGALHSYFNISAIAKIMIKGLEGCAYLDKVEQGRRQLQKGAIVIKRETDRVYLDTAGACIIEDSGLDRQIVIAKNGSRTTVVWNPWIAKAGAMKDFGDDEYIGMVCVETAKADTDVVSLAPGKTHTLETLIRLASLTQGKR